MTHTESLAMHRYLWLTQVLQPVSDSVWLIKMVTSYFT